MTSTNGDKIINSNENRVEESNYILCSKALGEDIGQNYVKLFRHRPRHSRSMKMELENTFMMDLSVGAHIGMQQPENSVPLRTLVDSQSPGIVSDAAKSSW